MHRLIEPQHRDILPLILDYLNQEDQFVFMGVCAAFRRVAKEHLFNQYGNVKACNDWQPCTLVSETCVERNHVLCAYTRVQTYYGGTLIDTAACHGYLLILKIGIFKAYETIKQHVIQGAIMSALQHNRTNIVKYLSKAYPNECSQDNIAADLANACLNPNAVVNVELYVSTGLDVNRAARVCIACKRADLIERLIPLGADDYAEMLRKACSLLYGPAIDLVLSATQQMGIVVNLAQIYEDVVKDSKQLPSALRMLVGEKSGKERLAYLNELIRARDWAKKYEIELVDA